MYFLKLIIHAKSSFTYYYYYFCLIGTKLYCFQCSLQNGKLPDYHLQVVTEFFLQNITSGQWTDARKLQVALTL